MTKVLLFPVYLVWFLLKGIFVFIKHIIISTYKSLVALIGGFLAKAAFAFLAIFLFSKFI